MAARATNARYRKTGSRLSAWRLATAGAVPFIVLFFVDLAGFHTNPSLGIVTFVLMQMVLLTGLLLIPFLWRTRPAMYRGRTQAPWPTLDFADPRVCGAAIVVLVLTLISECRGSRCIDY